MNKKLLLFFLLAVLLITIKLNQSSNSESDLESNNESKVTEETTLEKVPDQKNKEEKAVIQTDLQDEKKETAVQKIGPSKEQIKREYLENPERTPRSLILAGERIAIDREKRSLDNNVEDHFQFLERCVFEEETFQMQVICLWDAQRISKIHPSFTRNYQSLYREAPKDVTEFLDTLSEL